MVSFDGYLVWIYSDGSTCYHSRLCIEVPYAGGRVLEKGTEDLLRSVPKGASTAKVSSKRAFC